MSRDIEDLKSWLEAAMPDSMSRRTTMDFVSRIVNDAVAAERTKKMHALNLLATLAAHQPGCHQVCICGLDETIERLSK